ncbi:GNAT family N-acetyltransferase [Bacillus sp. P14.5]|uniref:GNAT family N-acetyltransferase n=1 Tax=Bacillus sp. P14.5 TaxID=1983400 RepID=UPI000DE92D70|nr:GNAT family N-acetyltransferase [Bacillus sp. P14.5]
MQLKKLTAANHQDVIKLFGEDVVHYHFLIDGMKKNNYEGNFKIFGEYQDNLLVSILINNYNNISYFSQWDRDISIYKELLRDLDYTKLSGPSSLMKKFLPYVDAKADTLSYLGVVKNISTPRKLKNPLKVIQTEDEIGMQYDLLLSTNEFTQSLPKEKEDYVQIEYKRLKESSDRTVYLDINGEMVSSCATIAEDINSAIIIGVVTNPHFRNKGYGTEVLIGLFQMLLEEGKYPYLFYNNPAARSVYKKIGMTEVCEWRVINL